MNSLFFGKQGISAQEQGIYAIQSLSSEFDEK